MIINRSFKDFKFRHRSKKNQIIYTSKKVKNDEEVLNLIDNFLEEKNSFIFESVEKGKIKGRYTIFGKNPDKIWEFNNNNSYLIQKNTKKKLKDKPENLIEKIIEDFQFDTPKNLPKICSLISGYFSYDSIKSVNDNKLFEINSIKMLFALPINSFALVNSSENKIYLVKTIGSNKNLFNKEDEDYKNFANNEFTNTRKSILAVYDQLLTSKYKIQLNQKTIDRVKNYFK